jgi:hypothetical protein
MSLFCFLWLPLFYLFWLSLAPDNSGSGGVWALLLGSVIALVHFFLGDLVRPGGFGFSRWAAILIDIVVLPAAAPVIVWGVFTALRIFSGSADLSSFALLWLIPGAGVRAISWSAQRNPSLLVLVPLLWTAIALGIPFFIRILMDTYGLRMLPPALGALIIPFIAATTYWAFFSQRYLLGALLFLITCLPMGIQVVSGYHRAVKRN